MERLSYDDFKVIALASERAFHLERNDSYNVASEDEPYGRWQRGEPDDYAWLQDWLGFLREATAAGTKVQRVRIVTIPHADYTRFGLVIGRLNAEAGEDLRYLPRRMTEDIDLPAEDYWLFDDDKLVLSVFSEDGRTGGFARETSEQWLRQCVDVRDRVWPLAVPLAQYVA